MSTSFAVKFATMKTSERVPCLAGLALKWGAWSTAQSGTMVSSSSGVGRRNMLYANSEAHARSVHVVVESSLTASLPLRATLLRQILLNLLLNAVAAAEEGGMVQLTVAAKAGKLQLAVCNDGEHIPDEQLAYLFEPFASGREKGHGLGLWIVYQIVQQLNGGLSVASEPGGCTTFSIEIPYVESA